jgi:glycosyltransferase involved in cell wall biosynthesis
LILFDTIEPQIKSLMKFIFASYVYTKKFNQPKAWLHRIRAYGGILEALSINNTIISIEQIDYEGEFLHSGVNYHFKHFSKTSLFFPFKLHRFIKRQKPDVVVIQGLHFPLQVIQLRLMLGGKVKIIAQNHAEQPFTGIKKHVQRIADRFIDAYLFASKPMGMDWVSRGNLASSKKIHEVMEVSSDFYPVKKAAAKLKTGVEGGPVFLWVGRLNENKDPLNVVKAFLSYSKTNPSARLYMIYHTGELLNHIKELLDNSAIKNTIILIGQVAHDDLLYWFNSADFIISGSHYEGSGTAVCEAMSCGCIPIVTDIFSFRMITDNGKCGILYEAGNEAALLSALIQSERLNIPEMQTRSLEYFKTNLSFEAIAQQIHEIADSL